MTATQDRRLARPPRSRSSMRIARAARAAQRFDPPSPSRWWERRSESARAVACFAAWILGYLALRPDGQAILLDGSERIHGFGNCCTPGGIFYEMPGASLGVTIFPAIYVIATGALYFVSRRLRRASTL
jgi:hypothetical protein